MQPGRITRFALSLLTLGVTFASSSCHTASTPRGTAPAGGVSASADATCPPGAMLERAACVCRADLRLLLGACVSPRTAADACGPEARVDTANGCADRPPCGAGRARDLATGECLARREVRNVAASLGILVGEEDVLGCADGSELASASGAQDDGAPRLGCLPREPSGSVARACPAGSLPGAGPALCRRVIARGAAARGLVVDVLPWVEAAIGADGGPGAPPLCRRWARAGRFLGSATPAEARFAVSLRFPDNDVSLVVAEVRSLDTVAAAELERVLRPMVEALRALGGTASHAAASTTVRCGRNGGARPSAFPAENDHER